MGLKEIIEWVERKFGSKVCALIVLVLLSAIVLVASGILGKSGADVYIAIRRPFQPSRVECLIDQIPLPPPDFVGREEELAKLLNAVRKDKVTVCGIRGMPGVGKTTLALKLAEELAPSYPDARISST